MKQTNESNGCYLRLKPELLDKLKTEANRSGNSVQCIIKICIAEHYDRLNAGSIA